MNQTHKLEVVIPDKTLRELKSITIAATISGSESVSDAFLKMMIKHIENNKTTWTVEFNSPY